MAANITRLRIADAPHITALYERMRRLSAAALRICHGRRRFSRILLLAGLACAAQSPAADIAWVWPSSDAPAWAEELALLTESLDFSGDRIKVRHRMRSLQVPPTVKVTPTVHVQLDLARPPSLGTRQAEAIESAVLAASRQSTSAWVQLDFEALDSQQTFYLALLRRLRARLPETIRLSVTVRAAWCDKPGLLDRLAADEVVPMFFRMGEQASDYRERLLVDAHSLAERCRHQAAGFAKQEALPQTVAARYQRRYWFNYGNWR